MVLAEPISKSSSFQKHTYVYMCAWHGDNRKVPFSEHAWRFMGNGRLQNGQQNHNSTLNITPNPCSANCHFLLH